MLPCETIGDEMILLNCVFFFGKCTDTGKIQRVAQERRLKDFGSQSLKCTKSTNELLCPEEGKILHITPSQSYSEVGGADCDLALARSLATDLSCCMRLCGLRAWDFVTWGVRIVTDQFCMAKFSIALLS